MAESHRICSVPDCGKKCFGHGLCNAHYLRMRRHGDPLFGGPLKAVVRIDECEINGCERSHYAKGLCRAHYHRARRHGDPLSGSTSRGEPMRWLKDHVDYGGDECLPWPYAKGSRGDSLITIGGRSVSAAAEICRLSNGEPPSPLHECAHNCGNGHLSCMNPKHLRWATRSENHLDKNTHGTMQRGERHYSSILTEDQVRIIRSSSKSGRSLAEEFGVNPGTIYAVRKKRNWAWLND